MSNRITDKESEALAVVAAKVYAIAKDHGFHAEESATEGVSLGRIAKFCANLHGEVSELWEAARMGLLEDQCQKKIPATCAEEELADIVIRAFDTAHTLKIDIGRAIAIKSQYNESRPHMHGKLA